MTFDVFDAQAALLYANTPELDFQQIENRAAEWCETAGLHERYTALPHTGDPHSRCFAGNGVHIWITVYDQPLEAETFALPLRSPLLKYKAFDFTRAIQTHCAAVVISVGDGEAPTPLEDRKTMAAAGGETGSHPFAKLGALQVALQVLIERHPPLMVDFRPSQSLLSPEEVAAVADLPLPVPILIHPFPFRKKTTDGKVQRGMAAIHAQHLIGAELELEATPADMPMAVRIETLASLVKRKMDGELALSHGDCAQTDCGKTVWIRHEEGSIEDGPPRIIVSFDTPATAAQQPESQKSFQDRVAQLKKDGSDAQAYDPSLIDAASADAPVYNESEEELRARVQATISPDMGRRSGGRSFVSPLYLLIAAAIGGYLYLSQAGGDIGTFASAWNDPLAFSGMQTQPASTSPLNEAPPASGTAYGKTVSAPGQPY